MSGGVCHYCGKYECGCVIPAQPTIKELHDQVALLKSVIRELVLCGEPLTLGHMKYAGDRRDASLKSWDDACAKASTFLK